MSRLLFSVLDTFLIRGRGIVLAADVLPEQIQLTINEPIELRRPDGSSIITKVSGIEYASPPDPNRPLAILLPRDISKEQVPVGTEVWSW